MDCPMVYGHHVLCLHQLLFPPGDSRPDSLPEGSKRGLQRSLFVLALGYYISFIGYILFPAVGPICDGSLYTVPLEGSFLTDFVRDLLNAIEHNKRDCMPSGHTEIVLIVLFLAYRYERFLFYLFFPLVCGLISQRST